MTDFCDGRILSNTTLRDHSTDQGISVSKIVFRLMDAI